MVETQVTKRRPAALVPGSRPLNGRVALVTGGGAGIGRGITRELLRAGALVVIGDLSEDKMKETCRELAAEGVIDWVRLDVSDYGSREAAVETIRARHGAIDILVNNAGIAQPGIFLEEDPHGIDKALMVDLLGAICLTRSVLPDMVKRGWGRITNISSMTAFTGSPGFAVYSAAKSGILSFTEAIERELRSYRDIRVTVVLPPSVKTQAFASAERTGKNLMRWDLVPPISVEQVARRTVHGLIAGRRRVYCAFQSYGASLTDRFAPWLMDRILMYMFKPPAHRRLPSRRPSASTVPVTP